MPQSAALLLDGGALALMSSKDVWKERLADARNAGFLAAAWLWRRLLPAPAYIGISGSVGKSTCTRCLEAILRQEGAVNVTRGNNNGSPGVYRTVLRTRRQHRFSIVEIGINGPGQMERRAGTVLPKIAVLTSVAQVHRASMRTLEDVAREKRKLLDALLPGGTAVLNGEDPLVREMRSPKIGKTVFFGNCPESVATATAARSSLQDGLVFQAQTPEDSAEVRVPLYGTHWLPSVLAAIAAARELGIPLPRAAAALRNMTPMPARVQPVALPNGAVLVRDEHNGSLHSAECSLAFVRAQPAARRFIIWSDMSDTAKSPRERIRWLLQQARDGYDGLIFTGELAPLASEMAIRAGFAPEVVFAFSTLPEAAREIGSILRSGDLALLRGRTFDHLARLVFAQFGDVGCWITDCKKTTLCDVCPELRARHPDGNLVQLPTWTADAHPVAAK